MDSMRDVLRKNLGRSLQTLPELDRLAAAWPVACGPALAEKGELVSYVDGMVCVQARNSVWLEQLRSMQPVLEGELRRIAAVPLTGIHFEVKPLPSTRPGPRIDTTPKKIPKKRAR